MATPLVRLPPCLREGAENDAVRVLEWYFHENPIGGCWDTFDPSGTRAESANRFTADDLLACSLLSTEIRGRATVDLMERRPDHFAELLENIGPDRDFVDVDPEGADFEPVRAAYRALVSVSGIGLTRATKLLARKRPRLVPIVDSVIKAAVFGGRSRHWTPLHHELVKDDRRLHRRLLDLHDRAELNEQVTPLRVFDVLAWCDGSGATTKRVLAPT